MTPDYVLFHTPEELHEELGITFTEEGWYKKGNDILLAVREGFYQKGNEKTESRPGLLRVMVWNDRDPRTDWRRCLSLPLFMIDGADMVHKEEPWLPPLDTDELKKFEEAKKQ